MAFNMKKPSLIKGSTGHKKALKQLHVRTTGYENASDGRSKSSAFQQNGDPVDPSQMTEEDYIRMADKQFEGAQVDVSGDYYDSPSLTDYVSHGFEMHGEFNEDGSRRNWVVNEEVFDKGGKGTKHYHTGELHAGNFINDIGHGRVISEIRRQHGSGSEQETEYNKTFYGKEKVGAGDRVDPNRVREYVMKYNNWLKAKSAMNEYNPGSGDDFTFQEYQQKITDANQKRELEKYNKENPITLIERVNPMGMSDKDLAVELVASGKYKTIDEAMSNIQNNSPARNYKKGYYN